MGSGTSGCSVKCSGWHDKAGYGNTETPWGSGRSVWQAYEALGCLAFGCRGRAAVRKEEVERRGQSVMKI